MNIRVLVRRVLLAREALSGRLDDVHSLAERIIEMEQLIENLRKVSTNIHGQQQYWYNLWLSMGREFENAQNAMIEEIGNLRKKTGDTGDKWEELVKKAFHAKYVEPDAHPVQGVRSEVAKVDCPPAPPAEVGNER